MQFLMCNMGYKDVHSLKPPYSIGKWTEQPNLTEQSYNHKRYLKSINQYTHEIKLNHEDIELRSPLSAALYCNFNSELLSRQRKEYKSHRSSTQLHARHLTGSRLRRLTSADSLCPGDLENFNPLTVSMAVMVDRKNVSAKHICQCPLAKKLDNSAAAGGESSLQIHPTETVVVSPAYLKTTDSNIISSKCLQKVTQPEFSYIPMESSVDDYDKLMTKTLKPDLHLVRQPVHLCLPDANVEHDDEDCVDGTDEETDTNRFLPQVNEHESRTITEFECGTKSLKVPGHLSSHTPEYLKPCRRSNSIEVQSQTLPTRTTQLANNDETYCPRQKRNLFTQSNKNMDSNIRHYFPSNHNIFTEISDSKTADDGLDKNKKRFTTSDDITDASNVSKRDVSKSNVAKRHTIKYNTDGSYLISGQFSNSKSDTCSKTLFRNNVKIREDKNITVNITPRNSGENVIRKSLTARHKKSDVQTERKSCSERENISNQLELLTQTSFNKHYCDSVDNISNSGSSTDSLYFEADHNPITLVNVDYEEGDDVKEFVMNRFKKKNDLKGMSSELSETDINSCITQNKSNSEKNSNEITHTSTKSAQAILTENVSMLQQNSNKHITPALIKARDKEFNPSKKITCEKITKCLNLSEKSKKDGNHNKSESAADMLQQDSTKREQTNVLSNDKIVGTSKSTEKLFTRIPLTVKRSMPAKRSSTTCHSATISRSKSNVQLHSRISSAPKVRPQPLLDGIKTRSFSSLSQSRQTGPPQQNQTQKNIMLKTVKAKQLPKAKRTQTSIRKSQKSELTTETLGSKEYRAGQTDMTPLGIDVGIKALERALYPQNRQPIYKHAEGYLPSDPCYGLLPHYKHWMPDEYKKLEIINKKLADDDRLRQMKSANSKRKTKKCIRRAIES